MSERPDNDDVGRMIYDLTHTGELSMLYRCRIADALDAFRALDAHTAAQPAPDAVADDMAALLKQCRDRISTDADAFFKAGRISRAITCDVLLDRIDAALAKEPRT